MPFNMRQQKLDKLCWGYKTLRPRLTKYCWERVPGVPGGVDAYTWGEMTSRNLWSRYVRHFVGIIWYNVTCGVNG